MTIRAVGTYFTRKLSGIISQLGPTKLSRQGGRREVNQRRPAMGARMGHIASLKLQDHGFHFFAGERLPRFDSRRFADAFDHHRFCFGL